MVNITKNSFHFGFYFCSFPFDVCKRCDCLSLGFGLFMGDNFMSIRTEFDSVLFAVLSSIYLKQHL